MHKKQRKPECSPLIDAVKARFNNWMVKTLSYAGRLQLITAVIYSSINFWLTTFSLPKGCLKTLERLCNRFLWTGDIRKSTGVKVSWSQSCLPKSEGGLGSVWNKVLSLKLVWLLFASNRSLWVAWNKEHRLKRAFF